MVVYILWSVVQFQSKVFPSRLVECMNSSNIRIHLYYEFIYLLQCNINEFIFFAVQNKRIHLIIIHEFI